MYAIGVERSMLCSLTSYSTIPRYKFPAYSRPTVEFGGKPMKALSQSNESATFDKEDDDDNDDDNDDDAVENHTCKSHGRRTVALMSTISFLFPLHISNEAFGATVEDEFQLIQGEVRKLLSKGKAPGVLRLVFHDAGTFESDKDIGGMNGSIVYELDRPENGGLKNPVKILEKAKSEVDLIQKVSWADMIAVAGAEAVSLCGGPNIPVQLGRIDSMVPDPEGKLPAESLDASSLKQCFQRKGFSAQELVALSGAHTIGGKGFGNPTVFDNSYFKILLEKPWSSSAVMSSMIGLPSDRALVEDDECLRWILNYANNQDLFFEDFKNAYTKLVNSGARWRKLI